MARPARQYAFGPFRLDAEVGVLYRGQDIVRLTPKAVETLVILVANAGRVLEKEELLDAVWPEADVGEACLAKNISTLRKALGEENGIRYIETVPKRGYRFAARVECIERAPQPGGPPLPAAPSPGPRSPSATPAPQMGWRWIWAAVALIALPAPLLLNLAAGGSRSGSQSQAWRPLPLTSEPGRQSFPALSPDGRWLAYVWQQPDAPHPQLVLRDLPAGRILPVVAFPWRAERSCWLADGRSLAFLAEDENGRAWYRFTPGEPRPHLLVRIAQFPEPGRGNSPCASPDGRWLAYPDRPDPGQPVALRLLDLHSGRNVPLTSPPAGILGDFLPAWSPDGRLLAFARATSYTSADLHVLQLSTGRLWRVTFDAQTLDGLAWLPDSSTVVFSSRRSGGASGLWSVPASGGPVRQIVAAAIDAVGPTVAARDGSIAFAQSADQLDLWRYPLGQRNGRLPAAPVIQSAFRDSDPDLSPGGGQIAFVSLRSGGYGIWVAGRDGKTARLLFDGGSHVTGSPRWSPDGRWIAFDSRDHEGGPDGGPSIWVIAANGGAARRLVRLPGAAAPSWSNDGAWIYFSSTASGRAEIWRVPAAGGTPQQITRNGGFESGESPDGRFLYFTRERLQPGIWRLRLDGSGIEEFVTDRCGAGAWRSWRIIGSSLYFPAVDRGGRAEIHEFHLQRRTCRAVLALPGPLEKSIPSLAVDAWAAEVVVARFSQLGGNIILLKPGS
ncbi:MAG: winged helix-turn-helix domain-containing protein [Bryobacterales bacterium]|nr:winged helix-turn-helix domain-containing protein [Bryobacterales bacterium]